LSASVLDKIVAMSRDLPIYELHNTN